MSIVQKYINKKGEFVRKDAQFRNFVTGKLETLVIFILWKSFNK